MRYTSKQYAVSLLEAIDGKRGDEIKALLARFFVLLKKNKDGKRLPEILREVERCYLKKIGAQKVVLESVSSVPRRLREEIVETFGKKIFLEEKIKPELGGGVKITINDEILIDAAIKGQLRRLFV